MFICVKGWRNTFHTQIIKSKTLRYFTSSFPYFLVFMCWVSHVCLSLQISSKTCDLFSFEVLNEVFKLLFVHIFGLGWVIKLISRKDKVFYTIKTRIRRIYLSTKLNKIITSFVKQLVSPWTCRVLGILASCLFCFKILNKVILQMIILNLILCRSLF